MKSKQGVVGSIRHVDDIEQVYLIGFKLDPTDDGSLLYSVVLYNEAARGDKNRPLTSLGRIVFFTDPQQMEAALRLGDSAFQRFRPVKEVAHIYDLARALDLLQHERVDPDAVVLNLLNEVFDFAEAAQFGMKAEIKNLLGRFADHLTFSRDLGAFFEASPSLREEVLGGLLWSLGAILCSSTVLPRKRPGET